MTVKKELFPYIQPQQGVTAMNHRKNDLKMLFSVSDADAESNLSRMEEENRLEDYYDFENPSQEWRARAAYLADLRAARFPEKARYLAMEKMMKCGVNPKEYAAFHRRWKGGVFHTQYAHEAAEAALAQVEAGAKADVKARSAS